MSDTQRFGGNNEVTTEITPMHALSLEQAGPGITLPQPPSLDDAVDIIKAGRATLLRFWTGINDMGLQVQMMEQIALNLVGSPDTVETLKVLFAQAYNDVVDVPTPSFFGAAAPTFSLTIMIEGAASLEFLYRYASLVNPQVFQRRNIPSPLLVSACLTMFGNLDSPAYAALKAWADKLDNIEDEESPAADNKALSPFEE